MADGKETCDYTAKKEDPSNWNGDNPKDWTLDEEPPVGLDQSVWECPHDPIDGKKYCPFHTHPRDLPNNIDEGQQFVEAVNEASAVDEDKMARRRKEFIGATFGAFDINNVTLDTNDKHPIRFDHARFERGVNAENALFKHNLLARRARFDSSDGEATDGSGQVSFTGAEFGKGKVSFTGAEFGKGKVSFNKTGFGEGNVSFFDTWFGEGEVSFNRAEFGEGYVWFDGAKFGKGEVSFDGVEFGKGEVAFGSVHGNAKFGQGVVRFGRAKFEEGEVSFAGVEFGKGLVDFVDTNFGKGNVLFEDAKFGQGDVLFASTKFGEGRVSFSDTEFGGGNVLFADANFDQGDVWFNRGEFGEGNISFIDTEFRKGKISFSQTEFGEGEVLFKRAEFGEGEVLFDAAKFGEGKVSFDSAIVTASISFINTLFNVESRVSFTDAEFRDVVTFGSDDHKSTPYVQHSIDFSGATFRRTVEFRGWNKSKNEPVLFEQSEQRFDFVFAGEVDFSNATFLQGIDFNRTRFPPDVDFTEVNLEDADFSETNMTGTKEFSEASFDGANLTDANFSKANLAGVSFERARLNRAELLDTNLAGAKLYGTLLGDARINQGTEFWLAKDDLRSGRENSSILMSTLRRIKIPFREQEPYCSYDPRYSGRDSEANLEKAGEMYATLEYLARDNSLPRLASDCFLGRKDVQLREYWRDGDIMMIVRALVPNFVARYGESPARVLGTGIITVLICGLAYDRFKLIENTESEVPVTLFDSLYFSGLTFTTLGYGDFNPANSAGQVLAVTETSIGVVLLAILVFVFGRRATR